MQFSTPVVFLIFRRHNLTAQVFEQIRVAKHFVSWSTRIITSIFSEEISCWCLLSFLENFGNNPSYSIYDQ